MSTENKTEKPVGDITEALQAKIADQAAEIDQLNTVVTQQANELKEAEALINEQQKKLSAEPTATVGGDIVVKHGKKSYRVVAKKFRYDGKEYTAKSLTKNKDLVAQLVQLGSSVLQPIK